MSLSGTFLSRSYLVAFLLVIVSGFMGCSSSRHAFEPINYPADIQDPYLRLEQVIQGDQEVPRGFFGRIFGWLAGPEATFSLNMPTDMVVDNQGRLLIVESEAGFVSTYLKTDGQWKISERIRLAEIQHPTSIAAGLDRLFISDLMGGVVHILDYGFNPIGRMEHADMVRPGGLNYDFFGDRLLIADPPANRVFIFSGDGQFIATIGRQGSPRTRLQSPIAIASDPGNGDIYVLDGMARKVKKYDTSLTYVSGFGSYDQVPGSFAFPKGIELSADGILFVADAAFGNIQMFDPTGALLFYFGETGVEAGQFLMPRNLFLDKDHHLYVADPYNNRIQIYRYDAQQ